MDGDDMRRGSAFFRRNQYKIAAVCVVAAALGLVGVYMYTGRGTEPDPQQQKQAALEETEETGKKVVAKKETEEDTEQKKSVSASTVIKPKKKQEKAKTKTKTENENETKTDTAQADSDALAEQEKETEQTAPTSAEAVSAPAAVELHFDTDAGLLWPVEGSVLLGYSMDQTVYFPTLDQYKYNPAVIISGNVNDKVKSAANGRIIDISTNEVTGCTVTMDMGDGYTAVYGQLKEVPYEVGAYIEAGNTIGFVSEPTKYYALEGSNVYFALQKDGNPVDPAGFFQ